MVNSKGGMEKVFCDMANELVCRGFEVSAICFDENEGVPGYSLESGVHFINAYSESGDSFLDGKFITKVLSWNPSRKQRKINRFELRYRRQKKGIGRVIESLRKVDVFISFQSDATFVLRELLDVKVPVVTMLHGSPNSFFGYSSFCFLKKAVEESSVLQVLRPEFVEEARLYVKNVPIIVIPNAVSQYHEKVDYRKKRSSTSLDLVQKKIQNSWFVLLLF